MLYTDVVMKWISRISFLLLPLSLTFLATADIPKNYSRSEQYERDGEDVWGYEQNIGTSAETFMSGVSAQTQLVQVPRLIPFGTRVVISCEEDTVWCWVQDSAATITADGLVTDAGSTSGRTSGIGGCFKVEGNSYRVSVSPYISSTTRDTEDLVSQRTKACSNATDATNLVINGMPCDTASSDCDWGSYSSSTCSEATAVKGNLLRAIAISTANDCWVNVVR